MYIKELSVAEFNNFAEAHPLGSFYQSSRYALVMAERGYDYDYLGFFDEKDHIHAASLILHKKIGMFAHYGYAPRGFLIDYTNENLLRRFTEELGRYYQEKNLVFIKINPEIAIGTFAKNNGRYEIVHNQNQNIEQTLTKYGYQQLKKNLYFEGLLPRFKAILPLVNFSIAKINKECRNKVKKSLTKGFELKFSNREALDTLYPFIKNNTKRNINFYKDFYNVFSKENLIDVLLVKINLEAFVREAKEKYEQELVINSKLLEVAAKENTKKVVNLKIQSDKNLISYKESMTLATKLSLNNDKDIYVAGAIIVKYKDRICILESGYDPKYVKFCSNYFLYEAIFEHYKNTYKFADLNGLTGDFSNENPYLGLNNFKLGFKARGFEFIGEYDLVLKPTVYNQLTRSGKLEKEFKN